VRASLAPPPAALLQPAREHLERHVAGREPFDHDHGLGLGRTQVDAMDAQEHDRRDERRALVAVDEGMVLGQPVCIGRRQAEQVTPLVVVGIACACHCRLEQADVAHAARPSELLDLRVVEGQHVLLAQPPGLSPHFASSRSVFL
jgi:hypothetical protein